MATRGELTAGLVEIPIGFPISSLDQPSQTGSGWVGGPVVVNLEQAAWEATCSTRGRPAVGWARLGKRVEFQTGAYLVLPGADDEDPRRGLAWAILLKVMEATRQADIGPGEAVGVLGGSVLAEALARFVSENTWAGKVVQIEGRDQIPEESIGILLDAAGDAGLLAEALGCVQPRGRVVWLEATGAPAEGEAERRSFNFYPEVHRHSLKLLTAKGVFQARSAEAGLFDHFGQTRWFRQCVERLMGLPSVDISEIKRPEFRLPAGAWIVRNSATA